MVRGAAAAAAEEVAATGRPREQVDPERAAGAAAAGYTRIVYVPVDGGRDVRGSPAGRSCTRRRRRTCSVAARTRRGRSAAASRSGVHSQSRQVSSNHGSTQTGDPSSVTVTAIGTPSAASSMREGLRPRPAGRHAAGEPLVRRERGLARSPPAAVGHGGEAVDEAGAPVGVRHRSAPTSSAVLVIAVFTCAGVHVGLPVEEERGEARDERRRHRRAVLHLVGVGRARRGGRDRHARRHDVGLDPAVDRGAAARERREVDALGPPRLPGGRRPLRDGADRDHAARRRGARDRPGEVAGVPGGRDDHDAVVVDGGVGGLADRVEAVRPQLAR